MGRAEGLALAALALVACDELVVPSGAVITCHGDAECPRGFACIDASGLDDGTGTCVDSHSPCIIDGAAVADGTPCPHAQGAGLCFAGLCALAYCGDGKVDATRGERCDDGAANGNGPGACRFTCVPAACGDGVVDPGEQCDIASDGTCAGCAPHMACASCQAQCIPGRANLDGLWGNGCEGDVAQLYSAMNGDFARFTRADQVLYHFDAVTQAIESKVLPDGAIGTLVADTDGIILDMRARAAYLYLGGGGLWRVPRAGGALEGGFCSVWTQAASFAIDAAGTLYCWSEGSSANYLARGNADQAGLGSGDMATEFVDFYANALVTVGSRLYGLADHDGTLVEIDPATAQATVLGQAPVPPSQQEQLSAGRYERQFAATATHLYALGKADRRRLFQLTLDGRATATLALPAPALAVDSDGVRAYVLLEHDAQAWLAAVVDGALVPLAAKDRAGAVDQGPPHALTVEGGAVLWSDTYSVYAVPTLP